MNFNPTPLGGPGPPEKGKNFKRSVSCDIISETIRRKRRKNGKT